MNIHVRSMIAGFIATVVLSLLMLLKGAMGLMPAMNVIAMLAGMAHSMLGLSAVPATGWLIHLLIGTVLWGLAFALLYRLLPGTTALAKGVSFSVLAWLLMMLIPMPMAGAGLFGLHIGPMVAVMTLVLHLIWGVVLGYGFGKLAPSTAATGA